MDWLRNAVVVLSLVRVKEIAYALLAVAIVTSVIMVPLVRWIVGGVYAVSITALIGFFLSSCLVGDRRLYKGRL